MKTLTFDKLQKTATSKEVGRHKFTIEDAKEVIAKSSGSTMIQFTYILDDSTFKIRFDNCPIYKIDNTEDAFGAAKLSKIMKATNVIPSGDFTIPVICKMLIGKSFSADAVKDKQNKYLVLGSLDSIQPYFPEGKEITPSDFQPEAPTDIPSEEVDVNTDPDF